MQMFSINRLAEMFQRDRSTVVRALRGLPRDGGSSDRPQYTVATASRALEEHFAAKSGRDAAINHDLQQKLDVLDLQYMAVQTAPTLAERRKRAPAFFRLVAQVEAAMYADAKRNGEDPFVAALRVNEHSRLNVLTLRNVLSWNSDETWAEFMKADPRTRDDDEAA